MEIITEYLNYAGEIMINDYNDKKEILDLQNNLNNNLQRLIKSERTTLRKKTIICYSNLLLIILRCIFKYL